jgi:uncharacterized protein
MATAWATVAAVAGAAGGIGAYASLVERRWYALRHRMVPALRPHARGPLRVLHLSDLHLAPGQEHKAAFVRRCLDADPDLVVASGDFLGHRDAIDPTLALLRGYAKSRPAVAVLGSNDFYVPKVKNPFAYLRGPSRRAHAQRLETARLVDGLTATGWMVLENARVMVDTRAGPVDVAGLGDPHIRRDRPDRVDWTPPEEPVALRLGVVHAPYLRALDVFASAGYDLMAAGHTHGGQVRLPGVGALVNNCDLPLGQARGLSPYDGAWLHVSAGIGTSIYTPFRFACRPEATILEVVAGGPANAL